MPELELDFRADWIAFMRSLLEQWGYAGARQADPSKVGLVFANALLRRVEPRPRAVVRSRELVVPVGLEVGFDRLIDKTQRGDDINDHLSKRPPESTDGLLSDWGIHHFHLGEERAVGGCIARTGRLLFGYVTDDTLYLLEILEHGAWSDQRLVRCIHQNWPDIIARFRLPGIMPPSSQMADEEIGACRRAGVTALVAMSDGTIYAPMGGGISTARTSMRAVAESDLAMWTVAQLEELVRVNIDAVAAELVNRGLHVPQRLALKLGGFGTAELFAHDKDAGITFVLPSLSEP